MAYDIDPALDNNLEVVLVMIVLSSAFDTVGHLILLNSLRDMFGFSGLVILWLYSYLSGRKQTRKH